MGVVAEEQEGGEGDHQDIELGVLQD